MIKDNNQLTAFFRKTKTVGGPTHEKLLEKNTFHVQQAPIIVEAPPKPIYDKEVIEKKLRDFDADARYGPCLGLTRIERYERAVKFGLNPPADLREIIMSKTEDASFLGNHWL